MAIKSTLHGQSLSWKNLSLAPILEIESKKGGHMDIPNAHSYYSKQYTKVRKNNSKNQGLNEAKQRNNRKINKGNSENNLLQKFFEILFKKIF